MHATIPPQKFIQTISNKSQWDGILSEIGTYDCYHTYDYHMIDTEVDRIPMLLYYHIGKASIALPLIKRPIGDTGYYDFSSVYGYAGPVFSKGTTQKDFENFKRALVTFCESEKIVSIFSRLNPYIAKQNLCLDGLGEINSIGKLVYIDLSKSQEEQKAEFSSTCKRYINKARRSCTIKKDSSEKGVETFMRLYHENMDRVNADQHYYFDKDYFSDLLRTKNFETEILFAVLEETNEVISGILNFKIGSTIHYHLSGTLTKYLNLRPLRLLIDEVRIRANQKKESNYLNLGGGLGSQEDSLYNFKASFSKQHKIFQIWKYIVNKKVYDSLVSDKNNAGSFFPAYREKNL